MKTFYRFINGNLETEQSADDKALPREGWSETKDHQLTRHHGKKETWFEKKDGDIKLISEKDRISRGIQIDNRGKYYNIETREEKTIENLDEKIDETQLTKEIPIENEMFQKFNGKTWVVDTEKKEKADKRKILYKQLNDIQELENKGNRPIQEIEAGIDVEFNKSKLLEYRANILDIRELIDPIELKEYKDELAQRQSA